jgi:hypothetical protein
MSGWRVAQHPASLDGLVPKELAAVPNSANGYPFAYYAAAGSYAVEFSYTGASMNSCSNTSEKGWNCLGYCRERCSNVAPTPRSGTLRRGQHAGLS